MRMLRAASCRGAAGVSAAVACVSFSGAAFAIGTCFIHGTAKCCSILSASAAAGYRYSWVCPDGTACPDKILSNPSVPHAGGVTPPRGFNDLSLGVAECVWADYECVDDILNPCQQQGTTTRACFPSAPKGKSCGSPNPGRIGPR